MGTSRLVKPSMDYRDAYMAFYEDWINSGEDIVPWVVEKDPSDFGAYLAFLFGEDSEEKLKRPNLVPHSTFWLMNDEDEVVGAVNIRHRLNDRLLQRGGHIGYGVRPSQRRKGYANAMLAQSLKVVHDMGIRRVLVTCDKSNIGSMKTIVNHGGVLESEFVEESGNVVLRFWIASGSGA